MSVIYNEPFNAFRFLVEVEGAGPTAVSYTHLAAGCGGRGGVFRQPGPGPAYYRGFPKDLRSDGQPKGQSPQRRTISDVYKRQSSPCWFPGGC